MGLLFCLNSFATTSYCSIQTDDVGDELQTSVGDEFQTNLVRGNETLKISKQEKVLVVTIDSKLNFVTHSVNITKKLISNLID